MTLTGNELGNEEVTFTDSQVFNIEDFGISSVPADIGCNFRTTVRAAGVHSQTLTLTDSNSNILWSTEDGKCSSVYLIYMGRDMSRSDLLLLVSSYRIRSQ